MRGGVRSLRRKRADVQFVKDVLVPRPSRPRLLRPSECARIDDDARTVHAVGLEAGCRIGHARLGAVEHVRVPCAGARPRNRRFEPAGTERLQRDDALRAVLLQGDLHAGSRGSVQTKPDAVLGQLRTERHLV